MTGHSHGPTGHSQGATRHSHGPTGPGTVVLNLGHGIGALVLSVPAELNGAEIEISSDSGAGGRVHSQVRERPGHSGTRFAAVYPDLPAGTYTIWRDGAAAAGTVTVTGGEVTWSDWP